MKRLFVIIILLSLIACANPKNKNSIERRNLSFVLPEPPPMLMDNRDKINYVVDNYWMNFNFNDTAYINQPKITEAAFGRYLSVLLRIDSDKAISSLKKTINLSFENQKMFEYFYGMSERYLYNPNSPIRNEELYISVLEEIVNSDKIEATYKIRPKYQLSTAMKNRVGTKAHNFMFSYKNGKKDRLYNINSDYILVYFNNPDCHACDAMTKILSNSHIVNKLINANFLTILSIYTDKDFEMWNSKYKDFPKSWLNVYDKESVIEKNKLYDLRAIPNLYLLDRTKNVILKDATAQQVEYYLTSIGL